MYNVRLISPSIDYWPPNEHLNHNEPRDMIQGMIRDKFSKDEKF